MSSTAARLASIDEDVLDVLRRSILVGIGVTLPEQLDRNLYEKTDKVLRAHGGKWNRTARQHLFATAGHIEQLRVALVNGEYEDPRLNGYFPTPPALAALVIERAEIGSWNTVLEPSAGRGALAIPAMAITGAKNVQCVELLEDNQAALRTAGLHVTPGDFLQLKPSIWGGFDRVVMNPPFSGTTWAKHVLHAWEFLKPGGRLVAIVPAAIDFSDIRVVSDVRGMLITAAHSWVEPLPDGSFEPAGTNVRTFLIVADKPGDER